VLLVTGRLAEPSLRRVLAEMAAPFGCDLAVLRITVAALMTTEWIARHLTEMVPLARETDLVLIPGLCEGDPRAVAEAVGVRVEKGPRDLREIPEYFGRRAVREYGRWDIEIAAEINDAPRLARAAVRRAADHFRESGADIIDIGCTPGLAFPALGEVVGELVGAGMRVSVDSFDADEIRTAVAAGAELVLSVNGSTWTWGGLAGSGARVVVVPDLGAPPDTILDTLAPTIARLDRWNVPVVIDPILEPIGHGLMASLDRYVQVRRRYPDAEMLMVIGNLTELTAADSTGVYAVLVAICQELGVRTVDRGLGPRRRPGSRSGAPAHAYAVTRRTFQGHRRSTADGQGCGRARLHGGRAEGAAGQPHRSQLPHLRRPGRDHRAEPLALRSRHRHSGDLRAARRARRGARVLSRQGAGPGQPRRRARQDLPAGGVPGVGLPHAARGSARGTRAAGGTRVARERTG
jgi:hypothetical protein